MKKVLIIKHIAIEGPGTLEEFLAKNDIKSSIVELYQEDLYLLSIDIKELQAVVILGGPMNVYEEDKYPFLKWEDTFIKQVLKEDIPFLGICLGSQLLAKAAGAKVYKAPYKEFGWSNVNLKNGAKADILFQGIKDNLSVFQWHEDTFDIPKEGILLAKTKDINQAFRIDNAYGLQFHIEVTTEIIKEWINYYFPKSQRKYQSLLTKYNQIKSRFESQRDIVFQNFLSFILPKN